MSDVTKELIQLLADTYLLYVKTQVFHWNVQDPRFDMLHKMFQEQYEDLAVAADDLAEQIRQLQELAPKGMQEILSLASLKEAGSERGGDQMIKALLSDHEALIKSLSNAIALSQKAGDEGTADLLIERLRVHTKAAWMLRSHAS